MNEKSRHIDTAALGASLGLELTPGHWYDRALTHASYAQENESASGDYQRLEFLGDAIVGAVVAEMLFRRFPDLEEGALSRLRAQMVSTQSLSDLANHLGIPDHLRLGEGEQRQGGKSRRKLAADSFEALTAAIHLTEGRSAALAFLERVFEPLVEAVDPTDVPFDYKGAVQHHYQERFKRRPSYRITDRTGPDHALEFRAELLFDGEVVGTGRGRTKKDAERMAAKDALARFASGDGHE